MNHVAIFNAIKADFSEEIALSACQINAINLTLKVKKKELAGGGNREERIAKKARKLLWELSDEDFSLSMIIWDLIHDWEINQTCHGLGGCEKKTFKELYFPRGKTTRDAVE